MRDARMATSVMHSHAGNILYETLAWRAALHANDVNAIQTLIKYGMYGIHYIEANAQSPNVMCNYKHCYNRCYVISTRFVT